MRTYFALLGLWCCEGSAVRHELPSIAAPPPTAASAAPHPEEPSTSLVWRVLDHVFVEEAGVPLTMRVVIQLEVGHAVLGPFELQEPGCTLGASSNDATVIAGLTCYYAGGGDYIEVRETSPGQYAVTTYAQSESFADEPEPAKVGQRSLGKFYAARPPLDQHIVSADGGAYEAYR